MNPSLCTADRKTDKHCEFWNEKEMGHIDTVQGSKMGPITTLNTEKWATSTLCRDQEQNGATHHSEQGNWVTSTLYRDQGKMGLISTLNRKKWVTSTLCRNQEQNGAYRQWAENSKKITKHFATSDLAGIRTRDTQQGYRRKAWADNKTKNTEDTASRVDPPLPPVFTKAFFIVSTSHCFTAHVDMM